MLRRIQITGRHLTRKDFYDVVFGRRRVALHPRARRDMKAARSLIEKMIHARQVVYGVTTGVGSLSTERIDPAQARQLQLNIVRSHACGVGEPLAAAETRAMLLLRANGLAAGLSGVRPAVVDLLCQFLNHGIHPVVPRRGSVGASGDLAPLAHLARALVGEGEVYYQPRPNGPARLIDASAALKRSNLRPLQLQAKEGLSLVNGTQAML